MNGENETKVQKSVSPDQMEDDLMSDDELIEEHSVDRDIEEKGLEEDEEKESGFVTLLRDVGRSIKKGWFYIKVGIGIGVLYLLYAYIDPLLPVVAVGGYAAGHVLIKRFIHYDKIDVLEYDPKAKRGRWIRIGKELFRREYDCEGSMTHVSFSKPVYIAEKVDMQARSITFSWIQDLTPIEFLFKHDTYHKAVRLSVNLMEKHLLHYNLPQVFGYNEAKQRIQKFVKAMNRILKDDSISEKYVEVPEEGELNFGGKTADDTA